MTKGPFDAPPQAEGIAGRAKMATVKTSGWGFKDSKFRTTASGDIYLTGSRYTYSGHTLERLQPFMARYGLDPNRSRVAKPVAEAVPSLASAELAAEFRAACPGVEVSLDDNERLLCAHGHTCQELFWLREEKIKRIPDLVAYPNCHADVEKLVALSLRKNLAIIPYGGGTCVSMALLAPENEQRVIVSVNTSKMNHILWVDRENQTACLEAGVVGVHGEAVLNTEGFTLGHEPDSNEFSTVGGWIATRASGMKKNAYGNIEDLTTNLKVVTAKGTFTRGGNWPRISSGPDLMQLILGSEGTLGIVTEVVMKIRPLPAVKEFASFVFPNFAKGVAFMKDIARQRAQPASLRLMDNFQFRLGSALKPGSKASGQWSRMLEGAKMFYLHSLKNFDVDTMCAATVLFEGDESTCARQKKVVFEAAKAQQGLPGGSSAGKMGYELTFMIAYIRDFVLDCGWLAESFETTVPWDSVEKVCKRVKDKIFSDALRYNVQGTPTVSYRLTQVYDEGACIYFYFGFDGAGLTRPIDIYSEVEDNARQVVMDCGGSISHHHGVGKLRKDFMERSVGQTGIEYLREIKRTLDPTNLFAAGNLV